MKKNWLNQIDNLLNPLFADAVNKGVFSGAAVGIFLNKYEEGQRYFQTHGTTRNDAEGEPVNKHTLFDLASLTKPLCTVLLILTLIEQKKIGWQTTLQSLLRYKTGPDLKKITIGKLLSHSAGLKAYEAYFLDYEAAYDQGNKKKIVETILKEPLAYQPGKKCLYSDLGYILLGEIIEQVSGCSLDGLFEREIVQPLNLQNDIFFRPLLRKSSMGDKKFAATEICPWRKKVLQGEVHDEHCWLMGGVSGHAGLFGNISGVLAMTENILTIWKGKKEFTAYSNELMQRALHKVYKNETWCMGFDTPSSSGSSAGKYMSGKSVGHLGYTGTSFWIDPEMEMVVVLLTNRVHPDRQDERIKRFRPLFHDTVLGSLNQA